MLLTAEPSLPLNLSATFLYVFEIFAAYSFISSAAGFTSRGAVTTAKSFIASGRKLKTKKFYDFFHMAYKMATIILKPKSPVLYKMVTEYLCPLCQEQCEKCSLSGLGFRTSQEDEG